MYLSGILPDIYMHFGFNHSLALNAHMVGKR